MVAHHLPSITKIYITFEAASLTQHTEIECTAEGQACAHSDDPFVLLRLQPSAKTYTLYGSHKALFDGMKHTNSLTIFAGTSACAITPLLFSPPTFVNLSLVVMSLTREKIPGSPHFSVLQVTESWAGPGNEANQFVQKSYFCPHIAHSYHVKIQCQSIQNDVQ